MDLKSQSLHQKTSRMNVCAIWTARTHDRKKCQLSSCEAEDEVETDAEQKFRIEFFNVALELLKVVFH